MRIKDYTDMVGHLTDSFNIPEARRMIQENPALTQEQFKAGGIVEPGVTHYAKKTLEPWLLKKLKDANPEVDDIEKVFYDLTKDQRADFRRGKIKHYKLNLSKEDIAKLASETKLKNSYNRAKEFKIKNPKTDKMFTFDEWKQLARGSRHRFLGLAEDPVGFRLHEADKAEKARLKNPPVDLRRAPSILQGDKNTLLLWMHRAAKENPNYKAVLEKGKPIGVHDLRKDIIWRTKSLSEYKNKKHRSIHKHPDYKKIYNPRWEKTGTKPGLIELQRMFKNTAPVDELGKYFAAHGEVPSYVDIYNYVHPKKGPLSQSFKKKITPLVKHHISGLAVPTRNIQLTFAELNQKAENVLKQYKRKDITLLQADKELKELGVNQRIGNKILGPKITSGQKQFELAKKETVDLFLKEQKKDPNLAMKILKRLGYKCKLAGGAGETVACYMSDVEKTRTDMKSSNVEVRAKALTKQRKALQLASKLPGIGKILKTGIQMGTAAITKPLKALGLTAPIGYAIEGIVEGGFYDNARRKGYSHKQAMAETFTPGLAAGRPEGVPWYGGAEKLREKELIGDPKQNPKVAQYVDALKEQDRIYDVIGRKEELKGEPTTTDETLFIPGDLAAASADVQDLARSGAYRRVDQTLKPKSMASQAYETAVEQQLGLDLQRKKEYLEEYDPGALEREEKILSRPRQLEKRYEAMEEKFPTYTREQLDEMLEAWGANTPWNLGFESGVKGYDQMAEWLKTHDKYKDMEAGVANRATGGIASLKK